MPYSERLGSPRFYAKFCPESSLIGKATTCGGSTDTAHKWQSTHSIAISSDRSRQRPNIKTTATDLPGFALKMTPKGGIAYTYRWTKPDGSQGRKVIGHWPVMQPGDARESARKEAALIDHKGDTDTLTVRAERCVVAPDRVCARVPLPAR
jgi:hypothetical protein